MSTEYIKTSWQDGDIITADKMNNIENGIKDVEGTIGELKENLTDLQKLADTKAVAIYETASGSIASFSDGADDMPLKSCVVSIDPIQEGSGDPSPENVRPISGLTGLNVARCGKNLLHNIAQSGTISGVTFTVNDNGSINIHGTSTTAITFIILGQSGGNAQIQLIEGITYTFSNCNVQINGIRSIGAIASPVRYTASKGDYISYVWLYFASGSTLNRTLYPQIEIGNDATAYESYKGTEISVNWESDAGTVYGGTLDVVSGKLTVDRAYIASYSGETLPSTWISDRDVYAEGTAPTTGAQVVYKLANPVEYQLSPQEIRTLLGENNIWSDGGDVEVEYPANTKMYIDQKITEAIAAAMA